MTTTPCPSCRRPVPSDAPGGLCPSCALGGVDHPTAADPSASLVPSLDEVVAAFPDLQIEGVLGQGGMGVVYRARQPRLDRSVALKILLPSLAARPGFAERFTREARVLAKLSHPSIVGVYDFGEVHGFYFLLMEFVDGVTLRQAMQAGLTPEQSLQLVPRICEALQFAHDRGVLHRDIKPENILLDRQGTPKLADFGIAKLAGDDLPGLTLSGAAMGTAAYMAPEQVEKPATVDHRADIYSLGVVLYEMLTGELPLGRFPAPSEKARVGEGVDAVVLRALEKERTLRQQSADELKTQVEEARTEPLHSAVAVSEETDDGGASRVRQFLVMISALAVVGIPASRAIPGLAESGLTPQVMIFLSVAFGVLAAMWPSPRRARPSPTRPTAPQSAVADIISPRRLFGYPLWHIANGISPDPRTGRHRVARGILAIGPEARGFFAIGGRAHGVIALGGMATGVVACGGLAGGLLTAGGVSIGLIGATGGLAIGGLARGGLAAGFDAQGGMAAGRLAQGGMTFVERLGLSDELARQVVDVLTTVSQGVGLACAVGVLALILLLILGFGHTASASERHRGWPAFIILAVTAACAWLMWEIKKRDTPPIAPEGLTPTRHATDPPPTLEVSPDKPSTSSSQVN